MISQGGSLSIAIVSVVNNTGLSNQYNFSTEGKYEDLPNAGVPIYAWSPEIQGVILSSFYYGALFSFIPSGYLTGILGSKKSLSIGLAMTSVLTILTPFAAAQGVFCTILTRVTGIFQQLYLLFWKKWTPLTECSLLSGISASGALLGNFTIFLVGGIISHSLGWPYILYIFGGIGVAFCVLSFFLLYDNPMIHPYISNSEKEYIISSLPIELQHSRSPPHSRAKLKAKIQISCSITPGVLDRGLQNESCDCSAFCQWSRLHSPLLGERVLPLTFGVIYDICGLNNLGAADAAGSLKPVQCPIPAELCSTLGCAPHAGLRSAR
ncbi:sodium-dependent phosphate transport protein 3-like [Notamacropus eugenii]|uniref:sodium-dependent phosphate transport protein 3-like n=1 Tax=Notamacropus eugenii TaxID=9315 RepID=UPI003B675E06